MLDKTNQDLMASMTRGISYKRRRDEDEENNKRRRKRGWLAGGPRGGGGSSLTWVRRADNVLATTNLRFDTNQGYNQGNQAPADSLLTVLRSTTGAVGAYAEDTSGKQYKFNDNTPRRTNKGLLSEETRIQMLARTTDLITGWGPQAPNTTAVSTDLPQLFPGIPIIKSTRVGTGDNNCGASAVIGGIVSATAYAASVYVWIPSGQVGTLTSLQLTSEGTTALSPAAANANVNLFDQWQRVILLGTAAGTAATNVVFRFAASAGLIFYWTAPQFEAGTHASSFIPNPGAATVTRNGDNIKMPGFNVAASAPITLYFDGMHQSPNNYPTNQFGVVLDDNTDNTNRVSINIQSFTLQSSLGLTGGYANYAVNSVNPWIANAKGKGAIAVTAGRQNAAWNGIGLPSASNSGAFGSNLFELSIGARRAGDFNLNGYITEIALWSNYAASQSALNSMTATLGVTSIDGVQATIDLDFLGNVGYNQGLTGLATALITTTRAAPAFIDNLAGDWTLVPALVPRISDRGLLSEDQRKNEITFNAPTGGVRPGTWFFANTAGLTIVDVQTGVINGLKYIDMFCSGVSSGTQISLRVEAGGVIPANNTTIADWCASVFITQVGAATNLSAFGVTVQGFNAGAPTEAFPSVQVPAAVGVLGKSRISQAAVLANASTTSVITRVDAYLTASGQPTSFTMRIALPGIERGAIATSPIETNGAGVTRGADTYRLAVTIPYQAPWTMSGQGRVPTFQNQNSLVGWTDKFASGGNGVDIMLNTGNFINFDGRSSTGPVGFGTIAPTVTFGSRVKGVYAFSSGAQRAATTGASSTATATQVGVPVGVTTFDIGAGGFTGAWNGYVERVSLWPGFFASTAGMLAFANAA